jgi:hypothetical protein
VHVAEIWIDPAGTVRLVNEIDSALQVVQLISIVTWMRCWWRCWWPLCQLRIFPYAFSLINYM